MAEEGADRGDVRDAFSLLAHDIRLDIVLALLEDWHAAYTEPKSYSELMAAVGMEDSGKFNYHLDKLRGTYVAELEDGYVPTASATALYRTVIATRPTDTTTETTLDTDRPCPHCDGELVGRYERGFLTVACADCDDREETTFPLPKNGLLNRTDRDVLGALERRATYEIGLARAGQCPDCAGTTSVDLQRDSVDDTARPKVDITCDTCSWLVHVDALSALLFVPEVTAVLVELDVVSEPYRGIGPEIDVASRIESTEPFRVAIDAESDEGTATIVVDEGLDVHAVTVA